MYTIVGGFFLEAYKDMLINDSYNRQILTKVVDKWKIGC